MINFSGESVAKIQRIILALKKSNFIQNGGDINDDTFDTLEAYKAPGVNYINDIYVQFYRQNQKDFVEEIQAIKSKYLSIDLTYRAA